MKNRTIALVLLMLFFSATLNAAHFHRESWYQKRWCALQCGETEVVLLYKTRCDCLTETHAIEFDFAKKWAEAIGQALFYSTQTEHKAGIVLIIENEEKDQRYVDILSITIQYYGLPIDVWTITAEELED